MMLAALPLVVGLALSFLTGLAAGALVNWAAYGLAWNRRPVSPWSTAHPEAPARRASDRLPLWGWIGLRRESSLHGSAFWVRPLAVELAMGLAWAALYWWEVERQGLVQPQFEAIFDGERLAAPSWILLSTFVAHGLLITLMTAASLIDVDEKTIPDGVTVPGTLLALVLAAAAPTSLLPHAALRDRAPAAGVEIPLPESAARQADPFELYLEPLTLTAPNAWPESLAGAPNASSLIIGLGCFATWCFALTPRRWRLRRGRVYGLRVLMSRVARELARPPILLIALLGAAAIAAVWYRGGPAWVGLLTALVGMIGGSAMVWAVRIVGSAALRREAMGFGDVTLMMMIGAFLGWQPCIFIFFIAPFAGLLVGILQIVLRRDDVIPYGPFLCLAAVAVMLYWGDVWNETAESMQAFFHFPWLVPGILALGVLMLGGMLAIWRMIKESLFRQDLEKPSR